MYVDKEKEILKAQKELFEIIPQHKAAEIQKKVCDAFEYRVVAGNDVYLSEENAYNRLRDEYEKHKLIVAFDFDNTVFDYNEKGYKFKDVIELLRVCKEIGYYLSVFNSDGRERIPSIEKYLKKHDIPYVGINENPDIIKFNGRKIYYNILLDDRAVLSSAYRILSRVIFGVRTSNSQKGMTEVA